MDKEEIRNELDTIMQMHNTFYAASIAPESLRECFQFPRANNEIYCRLHQLKEKLLHECIEDKEGE